MYWESFSQDITIQQKTNELTITDAQIIHRITHVLRLAQDESLIIFDRKQHALCTIKAITKKNCVVSLVSRQKNITFAPSITFLLPLLKREALETVMYSLVELGVTTIQLIKTAKTQRSWAGQAEYDRLQKIMIAAAEQSKNYALPELHAPCSLEQAIQQVPSSAIKLYADPEGIPLREFAEKLTAQQDAPLTLMIGPEGDLNAQEKAELLAHNFIFCALTPTVLRSVQAGALFAGIMRSLYR